jgi:hypothetical protein
MQQLKVFQQSTEGHLDLLSTTIGTWAECTNMSFPMERTQSTIRVLLVLCHEVDVLPVQEYRSANPER